MAKVNVRVSVETQELLISTVRSAVTVTLLFLFMFLARLEALVSMCQYYEI